MEDKTPSTLESNTRKETEDFESIRKRNLILRYWENKDKDIGLQIVSELRDFHYLGVRYDFQRNLLEYPSEENSMKAYYTIQLRKLIDHKWFMGERLGRNVDNLEAFYDWDKNGHTQGFANYWHKTHIYVKDE